MNFNIWFWVSGLLLVCQNKFEKIRKINLFQFLFWSDIVGSVMVSCFRFEAACGSALELPLVQVLDLPKSFTEFKSIDSTELCSSFGWCWVIDKVSSDGDARDLFESLEEVWRARSRAFLGDIDTGLGINYSIIHF